MSKKGKWILGQTHYQRKTLLSVHHDNGCFECFVYISLHNELICSKYLKSDVITMVAKTHGEHNHNAQKVDGGYITKPMRRMERFCINWTLGHEFTRTQQHELSESDCIALHDLIERKESFTSWLYIDRPILRPSYLDQYQQQMFDVHHLYLHISKLGYTKYWSYEVNDNTQKHNHKWFDWLKALSACAA